MTVIDSAFRFDADAVLIPISADEPTGGPLRYEGTYDMIAALRREDDPALEQGVWKTELKKADWPGVAEACLAAIETKSKDVQIAAWLLEAWIHMHGFAGLREGLHLIAELCDTYWDSLHPEIIDGDLDYRLSPLYWIDEKLSIAARLTPIVRPETGELDAYSLADWELACRRPARPRQPPPPDALTEARFQKSVAATPTGWLMALAADARGALRSLDELVEVLKAHCGARAPALAKMREAIASAAHVVSNALESRGLPARSAPEPPGADETDAVAPVVLDDDRGEGGDLAPPIQTRAEAYRRLAEAADFLSRTEPHSPVPFLVRRAIGWGGLTLEQLLPELVRDSAQLGEIFRMLQLGEKP
ncbi:MAG TPA: type VI secretion system protein TssA [Vicinamibacterales bacterium]|nr:type VI secretion system protein TssA [Vicinamibacterales bacterium]